MEVHTENGYKKRVCISRTVSAESVSVYNRNAYQQKQNTSLSCFIDVALV